MITKRDLELEYQKDTGHALPGDFIDRATSAYPFFEWLVDQLLTYKNKQNDKHEQSKIDYGKDFEFS